MKFAACLRMKLKPTITLYVPVYNQDLMSLMQDYKSTNIK